MTKIHSVLAALLAVVLLLTLCACAVTPSDDPTPSHSEEPTPSHSEEPTPSQGEEPTPSQGQEDPTPSQGQEEPTPSQGQEDPAPQPKEGAYEPGDPSVYWEGIPSTTLDPDHPYRMLVNYDHALPEGYQDNIVLKQVTGTSYKLQDVAADALNKLIAAAKEDGIKIKLCSGFRKHTRQIELYTARIKTMHADHPTWTWDACCREAATVNAYPGTSEHETGLCWDFDNLYYVFDQTKEFAWLIKHCTDFGFVMRYPKEKGDITHIIYEPWHYRYVGVEDAKEMERLGMCLEEYTAYLATLEP